MAEHKVESGKIGKALKKHLVTGVLVWLPTVVTIWVINYIVSASDQLINLLPLRWQPKSLIGFDVPGLGVILTVTALFITGLFGVNVLGKRVIPARDGMLSHIPIVKSIYTGAKKVSESLLSDGSRSFKTPVLVPFPQPEVWTLALVFGSIPQALQNSLPQDKEYVSVYVPTAPNPTDGYYIMVKKSDMCELNMSVDEVLKCVISLGMVMPDESPIKFSEDDGQSGGRIS